MHALLQYNNQYLDQDIEFYNVLHVDHVDHRHHVQTKNRDLKSMVVRKKTTILKYKINLEHFPSFEQEMFHVDLMVLITNVQLLYEEHFYETILDK